jgi:hypothetical protein
LPQMFDLEKLATAIASYSNKLEDLTDLKNNILSVTALYTK